MFSDIQSCAVQFESFNHNTSAMQLSWLPSPVQFSSNIHFASYSLLETTFGDCTETFQSGTFPCEEVRFVLQRKLGYFFVQVSDR